ncbi:MAG: protein-export chaperone SecB, partial [Proteobacteria bacterium]|nr:protein-export chaperone SecB [Pseudomonadota bacterium]
MADEQDISTENPQSENPMDGIPERFTEEPADDGQADGMEMPPLTINAQYVKDLSFEAPNTPGVFEHLQTTAPEIGVEVDINANAMGENRFEAAIKLRAEARVNDTVVYIIELEYAGLFTINVPEEHLGTVLLIDCPLILFPFARRIIADTTSDGSMAPLMLAPIDFAALYQQKFLEQQ